MARLSPVSPVPTVTLLPKIWGRLTAGCAHPDAADQIWAELVEAYGHPDRKYHNLNHIAECAGLAMTFFPFHDNYQERKAFWLALLCHDVVHAPGAEDNARQSATWIWSRCYRIGWDAKFLEQACRIVESTDRVFDPRFDNWLSENFLIDMDLAVLASSSERYREYARGVCYEFERAGRSPRMYKDGRVSFLEKVLALPHIFWTEIGERREWRARCNVTLELESLLKDRVS